MEPLARTLPLLVALAACNARGVSFVPKADAADDLSSPDDVTHADVAPDRATPRDATSDEGLPGLDVAPRDVAGPPERASGRT